MNRIQEYNEKIANTTQELNRTKKLILNISSIRLILFFAGVISLFLFAEYGFTAICLIIISTFLPFVIIIKYHNKLFERKTWLEKANEHFNNEIKAINNDLSPFDGGKEFINPSHNYTFDLDIFGDNHTLFQLINRTSTQKGKETLANWMNNHLRNEKDIYERQEAVKELSTDPNFIDIFRIEGLLYESKQSDFNDIEQWIKMKSEFANNRLVKLLLYLVPTINFTVIILSSINIISSTWIGVSILLFVVLSTTVTKKIDKIQYIYENKLAILTSYTKLINLIERREMRSSLLKELRSKLFTNGKPSEKIINELNKSLDKLNLRNNQILYTLLEGTMFWQLRQIYAIEKWKDKYGNKLIEWMETTSTVDAICSMANFAYNHQEYNFPKICDKPFIFEAEDMGHPLMNEAKCVLNDAVIPYKPFFIIITGANMAGKSTYLRTIGINYIMACIGLPVFAKKLKLTPSELMTSLRTTDSLTENESYFFAEIKRLGEIIEKLKHGEEMFIILDEILKGTNSVDKQKGSFSLVKQLIELKSNGIIATHDLMLSSLANEFSQNIKNYRFEADIINNELSFTYKLREGVAQNMNACFLMKKMGINV